MANPIESGFLVHFSYIAHQSRLLLHEKLSAYDLTPQQARIVGFIGTEQEEGKIVYQKDVEDALQLKRSSITSLLQGLEQKDFILRYTDPEKENRKVLKLLPKGQALIRDSQAAFHDIDEQLVKGLTAEQQHTLSQLLSHLVRNID
jgi:MarR family transcriptional regulator, repressor for mepA